MANTTYTLLLFVVQYLLLLASVADTKLVLPSSPPRGFNSFDNYGNINASRALAAAGAMKAQLLPSGFDTFTIDGGWSASDSILANGTKVRVQHLDEYGRAIPAPDRYPDGMAALAKEVKALGLKFGLWTIRGVHKDAVAKKLKVKGTEYTIDELVDEGNEGGGKNGSCLWASEWLGVNASHPAAQAYYDSRVELLVEQGVDFIKADCMMCGPCYYSEMQMFTSAVKKQSKYLVLSYSPGGGNTPKNGRWVADNTIGTMYRTVTDFHGGFYGWGGLQQAIFIAGNFTSGDFGNLHGANGTWADIDMLPLDSKWWSGEAEQADRGQTIMTLWTIGKYPLMHAGELPSDAQTLHYLTNPTALKINSDSRGTRVVGYEGNCSCNGGISSCTLGKPQVGPSCVATWAAEADLVNMKVDTAAATVVALINMGEANATVQTSFASLGLSTSYSYDVTDIWTGTQTKGVKGDGHITTALRMHASALYSVVAAAGEP